MHELGIVFHVAKQVEEIAAENNVKHIAEVVLQVGEVSTVIPEQLIDCWNWNANRSDVLRGCKLTSEMIPAVTFCEGCSKEYPTVQYGKTCPHCGSGETYLITGNETILKEIVSDDAFLEAEAEADETSEESEE